jgi:hypothetical protein
MANDAFALSPISASGTLPSETDYHAISEAFMETSRGRWFLKEYARRNRNTDTAMVLEAVSRIESTIAAQKQQPPATGLADAMETISAIIDDARAQASQAVERLVSDETFAPSRKGVRIIHEVAWRLREIGYDGRICDILEMQANAIGANHDASVTRETHDAVLASFDLVARQIGELAANGSADTSAGTSTTTSPAPPPADLTEARLAREKNTASEPPPAQPVAVQPLPVQTVPPQPMPENVVSLATVKPAMQPPLAQAAPTVAGLPDVEIPVAPPTPLMAEARPAAPASASLESTSLRSEQVATAEVEAVAATIEAERPASAQSVLTQSVTTAADAEAGSAPEPEAPLSLGESLLARGVVTSPGAGKTDPLAPFRRMSQAEKIAFFS